MKTRAGNHGRGRWTLRTGAAALALGTAAVWASACGDGGGTEPIPPPPANRPPVVSGSIPAQTILTGSSVNVNVASAFSDPDGDAISYRATSSSAGVAGVALSGATVTITGVSAGAATLTVTATDPGGLSASLGVPVTVEEPNRAPAATVAQAPAQTAAVGDTLHVDAAPFFNDPDEDPLTYEASSSDTSVATVSEAGSVVSAVAVDAGSATPTVTATGPDGLSAQTTVPLTVLAGSVTRLTFEGGQFPAWSRDGRIAFTSNRDGNFEIYVMNADGSGVTRLSSTSSADWDPAWSPDGARIAFASNRDGNDEIYVMNADGSDVTRLTNSSAYDSDPVWSPDGARIAFASWHDGNIDIYVMNADGSGVTRLTREGQVSAQ